MKNTRNIVKNNCDRMLLLTIIFLNLFVVTSVAQTTIPWAYRPTMGFSGQYDIRMISGQVLQAAFLRSQEGQPFDVIKAMTDKEMQSLEKYLAENNYFSRPAPNGTAAAYGGSRALDLTNINASFPAAALVPAPPSADGKYEINRALVYADCDADPNTFQSSCAKLDFGDNVSCTTVKAAYLYWVGSVSTTGVPTQYAAYPTGVPTMNSYPAGNPNRNVIANYKSILFKAPHDINYTPVTATRVLASAVNDGDYACFADVTSLVKGKTGGLYWVANISSDSYNNGGAVAGWTLIVIFTPPNCPPRVIKFWDGFTGAASDEDKPINLTFATGEVPASGNSISYLGFTTMDGEANPANMLGQTLDNTLALKFQSAPGGTLQYINPFVTDQPADTVYDAAGTFLPQLLRAGMSCAEFTNYDPVTNTNGNQMVRLPNQKNIVGYGAHQVKLPSAAMVSGATSATMTLPKDVTGSYNTFMQFMAIQTLQPDLKLYKRAESPSVAPNGTLTYVLTVKNIGLKASAAGAFITDTLDKTVNFVPGSVAYYDKSNNPLTPNFTVQNQGANNIVGSANKESLTFTLPSIGLGTGVVANDSVVIKFQVKVQDLSRTDIWNYGCNRYAKNKASLTFKADDGSDLVTGSNSSASCTGQGAYYSTPIVDAAMEIQYQKSHNIADTLTQQVNAANLAGTKVYIVKTLKTLLAQQLATSHLTVSDTAKYVINNDADIAVLNSAYFTQNNPIQKYTAVADYGSGCIETYYFTLVVAKIPSLTLVGHQAPSCYGGKDGVLNISIKDGVPGYSCTVYDASNNQVYFASQPTASDPAYFKIEGLSPGIYKVVGGDQGTSHLKGTDYFTLNDTTVLAVSLGVDKSICKGDNITLLASTVGLNYVWKEKLASTGTWSLRPETTQSIVVKPTATTDYIVYVCNGTCQATDTVRVNVNPVPKIVLYQDTTVSISINPTATFAAKVTNYTAPIISYTWTMSTDHGVNWFPIPAAGSLGTHSMTNDSTLSVSNITDTIMNGYKYKVSVKDNAGCVSHDTIATLTVVEGPAVILLKDPTTSCSNISDGKLVFKISAGEKDQKYSVNVYTGSGYDDSNLPVTLPIAALNPDFIGQVTSFMPEISPLAPGQYTMILKPIGGLAGLKTYYRVYTVTSPPPVTVSFTPPTDVCSGKLLTATAIINGGPAGGTKSYSWESSLDGVIFTPTGEVSPTLREKLDVTTYFRVIGNVNTCADTSSTVQVNALPTPKISMLASDSGCYEYDLHTLQVTETSGLTDYVLTLHSAMPSSPTDNRFLIPESKYLLNIKDNKKTKIYARMTVGGLCDSVASGEVYIKEMEECYPIVVMPFFSPDGDGINDRLTISGIDQYRDPQIIIYDRYGKVVFKGGKQDMMESTGWDGTYLGKPLPSGDYWYTINFTEIKPKVGHFALKRKKE